MTTVYGVTFVGAREQIEKQLRIAEIVGPDMRYMASAYLANLVGVTLELTMEPTLTLTSRHFAALVISSEAPRTSNTGYQLVQSLSAGLFRKAAFPCLWMRRWRRQRASARVGLIFQRPMPRSI